MATAGRPILSRPSEPPQPDDALPAARIRRRRWLPSVVWIVPVVAAVVAGYLVHGHLQERGPTITIRFADVTGVREGQTEIRHRGVPVGRVKRIELSDDQKQAVVTARLRREAAGLATEGSVLWIVRPEVRLGDINRLGTIVSGPYIEVRPGSGKAQAFSPGSTASPGPSAPG
jgi:paraquat-inducible protein B